MAIGRPTKAWQANMSSFFESSELRESVWEVLYAVADPEGKLLQQSEVR